MYNMCSPQRHFRNGVPTLLFKVDAHTMQIPLVSLSTAAVVKVASVASFCSQNYLLVTIIAETEMCTL